MMPQTILKVILYGDLRLEAENAPVTEFNGALADLAHDLFFSMYAHRGIGLAAPQVGLNSRLAVIDLSAGKEEAARLVLCNPVIEECWGRVREAEGCLSFVSRRSPGVFMRGHVTRPEKMRVRFQDVNGQEQALTARGLLARAVCHEVDHLYGVLFTAHLGELARKTVLGKSLKAGR